MQHDLKTKGSVIVMKYDEYLNACLKFAKDTENWSWLDRSRWFTTNGGGDYEEWCCTIKVDIENSKGQYIEKDKQEATKDGSESTKIQHGI